MSNHPICLDGGDFSALIGHHPFAAFNCHAGVGIVMDGDEIDKAVRPIGRGAGEGIKADFVHRHMQPRQFYKVSSVQFGVSVAQTALELKRFLDGECID